MDSLWVYGCISTAADVSFIIALAYSVSSKHQTICSPFLHSQILVCPFWGKNIAYTVMIRDVPGIIRDVFIIREEEKGTAPQNIARYHYVCAVMKGAQKQD